MPVCKVRRDKETREIENVLVDRPFDTAMRDLISSYMSQKLGQQVVIDSAEMERVLRLRGFKGLSPELSVFHGSPHRILDRFSTEHIGTGEGIQAFGWGLYFTDLESIARYYAKKLSNDRKSYFLKLENGDRYELPNTNTLPSVSYTTILPHRRYTDYYLRKKDNVWYEIGDIVEEDEWDDDGETIVRVLNRVVEDVPSFLAEKGLKENEDFILTVNGNILKGVDLKSIPTEFIEKLKQYEPTITYETSSKAPNLYIVTLHKGKTPDQYTWLEWDKPLTSEQKELLFNSVSDSSLSGLFHNIKISDRFDADSFDGGKTYRVGDTSKMGEVDEFISTIYNTLEEAEVEALRLNYLDTYVTGKDLSEALAKEKGNKAASLFLLKNGIDGIKYPAESISRGATSDNARGFNYVVFDENAITIEEHIEFLKTSQGDIYGFVDNATNIIYLDPKKGLTATLLHEGSHIWQKAVVAAAKNGDKKAQEIVAKRNSIVDPIVEQILRQKQSQTTTQTNLDLSAQYAKEDEMVYDNDGNVIGVKPEVLAEIAAEKEQIETEAKANGTFGKAPNGEQSNLTNEQWITVRTSRFKDWFGDWMSVVNNMSIDKTTDNEIKQWFGENIRPVLVNGEQVGSFIVENIDGLDNVVRSIAINKEFRNKGYAKATYLKYVLENGEILSGEFKDENDEVNSYFSEDAKKLWDSLKRDYNVEIIEAYNYKRYKLTLKANPKISDISSSKVVDENGEPMVIQGVFINSEYKIIKEC